MQTSQRFVADQRFDLPQYEAMIDFISAELDAYNKAFFVSDNAILKNWKLLNAGGLTVQVDQSSDSSLFNSKRAGKEEFILRPSTAIVLSHALADNATNYVEVQIYSTTCAPDTVALWDATANANEGAEFTQTVNTQSAEAQRLVSNTIAFSGDPDKLPLAVVVTAGGVITSITDTRSVFFRSKAWNFGVTRSDATIFTIKDMYDAITTSLAELKGFSGTNWFDQPWTSFKLLREYQNLFVSGGGSVLWEGAAGAGNLQWSAAIKLEIAGRPSPYTIAPDTKALGDGDCLYVDIPAGTPIGNLTPIVTALTAVPIDPAVSGQSARLMVLFFRRGNTIYGMMDIPVLDSGETAVIGQDLPQALRTRLGFISENSFVPYASTAAILSGDSYPVAISKIDAAFEAFRAVVRPYLAAGVGPLNPANHNYASTSGAGLSQSDSHDVAIGKLDAAIAALPAGGGGTAAIPSTVQQEIPTGNINGVNTIFTLAHTPLNSASLVVIIDSEVLRPSEYSLTGNTITLSFAPVVGQIIQAYYADNTGTIALLHESIAGANGVTTTFNTVGTPASALAMVVAVDGLILNPGEWNLLTGPSRIQFNAGSIPQLGQDISFFSFVDGLANREIPTGVINGVNGSFTLSGTPANAKAILVMIDGRVVPYIYNWNLAGNIIQFAASSIPPLGSSILAFYYIGTPGGGGGGGPDVGDFPRVQYITLSSTDITNKFASLAYAPYLAASTILDVPSIGTQEIYGTDFIVSGAQLGWSGLGLDGILIAGDVLRVLYFT